MSISHAQNFFFFSKLPVFNFQSALASIGANSEKLLYILYNILLHE